MSIFMTVGRERSSSWIGSCGTIRTELFDDLTANSELFAARV